MPAALVSAFNNLTHTLMPGSHSTRKDYEPVSLEEGYASADSATLTSTSKGRGPNDDDGHIVTREQDVEKAKAHPAEPYRLDMTFTLTLRRSHLPPLLFFTLFALAYVVYMRQPVSEPTWVDGRDVTPRPDWWPDEEEIFGAGTGAGPEAGAVKGKGKGKGKGSKIGNSQWGWTEEMGWKVDRKAGDLGEEADGAYKLGFKAGEEGVQVYVDRLVDFAKQLNDSIEVPLLSAIQQRFPKQIPGSSTFLSRLYASDKHRGADAVPNVSTDRQASPRSTGAGNYVDSDIMIHHKTIYQTNKALVPESINKWNAANRPDRWDVHFFDDWQGDRWVRDTFNGTVIQWAWSYMTRPVLRADFLRYMLPLVNGGVYVDIDTTPITPIEQWGTLNVEYLNLSSIDGPNWRLALAERPSIVVGLEADAHSDFWQTHTPRPSSVCQWALASAPFHPIMLDAVRRVVNATQTVFGFEEWRDGVMARLKEVGHSEEAAGLKGVHHKNATDVMEWTGPGIYLLARYNVSWHRVRHIQAPLRIGDVLILPVTGFNPGSPEDSHGHDDKHEQAALVHHYHGSWKHDKIAI